MTNYSSDAIFVHVSDLKRLFLRLKGRLWRIGRFAAVVTFCFLLLQEPQYIAKASFKHATAKADPNLGIKNFLNNTFFQEDESSVVHIMRSYSVLSHTAAELGLQAKVAQRNIVAAAAVRIWDNFTSEIGGGLTGRPAFIFRKVNYSQEGPLKLFICLNDAMSYEILNAKKEKICSGQLGWQAAGQEFSFVLQDVPKNVSYNKLYPLTILPMTAIVEKLQKKLEVKPDKTDKKLLFLSYADRSRHLAAQVLNQAMESYQRFLKSENEAVAAEQIAYLERRESELFQKLDKELAVHAAYLKKNVAENGTLGLSQQIEMLEEPKNDYLAKIFEIDLGLKRFKELYDIGLVSTAQKQYVKNEKKHKGKHKDKVAPERSELLTSEDAAQSSALQYRISDLGLEEKRVRSCETASDPGSQELQALARQNEEISQLLTSVEEGREMSSDISCLHDPKSLVYLWARQVGVAKKAFELAAETEKSQKELDYVQKKRLFASDLRQFLVSLEQKRSALEENALIKEEVSNEFAGLTLEMAQKLYLDYNQQLDSLQASMRQLLFLRDQVQDPAFELSSLVTVLSDPVTQELVGKASEISLSLQDGNNRSAKEQERLREALTTQKQFIGHHLEQTVELSKLRAKLLEEKLASLQKSTIGLMQQEKKFLEEKLQEISLKMADVPEKWRVENQLLLKKDMCMSLLHGLAELTESKNIGHNLFQADSRPLDRSLPPLYPRPPRLILFSLLAAFLAALAAYLAYLFHNMATGMPVSLEMLQLLGIKSCGELTADANCSFEKLSDKNLETLRRTATFLAGQNASGRGVVGALICGKNSDFSRNLAELLSMQGKRVLAVQCVFDAATPSPGLWQYLSGEVASCPIQKQINYDYLPMGGSTRHGVEMLHNPKFLAFLSAMKERYEYVLLFSSASPVMSEAHAFLALSDAILVAASEEKQEEILLYRAWADKKNKDCVAFVNCSKV